MGVIKGDTGSLDSGSFWGVSGSPGSDDATLRALNLQP